MSASNTLKPKGVRSLTQKLQNERKANLYLIKSHLAEQSVNEANWDKCFLPVGLELAQKILITSADGYIGVPNGKDGHIVSFNTNSHYTTRDK